MKSPRSLWIGWVSLGVLGGGAYYLAKQGIIADRAKKFEIDQKRKAQQAAEEAEQRRMRSLQDSQASSLADNASLKRANMARFQSATDDVASPSSEGSHDPAATRHEPQTEEERILEKSKYETAVSYRPPKGNRLS